MTFILLEVRDSFQNPGALAKYTHVTVVAETVTDLGILHSGVSQPVGRAPWVGREVTQNSLAQNLLRKAKKGLFCQ
jgi:hypothetical protein